MPLSKLQVDILRCFNPKSIKPIYNSAIKKKLYITGKNLKTYNHAFNKLLENYIQYDYSDPKRGYLLTIKGKAFLAKKSRKI